MIKNGRLCSLPFFIIALAQKTTGYAGENKRLIVQKTSF